MANKLSKKTILIILLSIITIIILIGIVINNYKIEKFVSVIENDELKTIELETTTVNPAVFIFSTTNRFWDHTCQNHVDIIRKITGNDDPSNAILGIHHWSEDVISDIPEMIKKYDYNMTISPNINDENDGNIRILKRFYKSTKEALHNAETLFLKKYGYEMPEDQIIVRIRCDSVCTDIGSLSLPPKNKDKFFMSLWNTEHRPYDPSNKEIADVLFYSTKRSLHQLLDYDFDAKFPKLMEGGGFHESLLYKLMIINGIDVYFDFGMKLSLYRGDNNYTKLS